MAEPSAAPNDAHLVQLVRASLGRDGRIRGLLRPNVSSCGHVVTLHGVARNPVESGLLEGAVRRVPGVLDVVNKLAVAPRPA